MAEHVRTRRCAAGRRRRHERARELARARSPTTCSTPRAGPETGPSTMTFAASLVAVAALGRVAGRRPRRRPRPSLDGRGELAAASPSNASSTTRRSPTSSPTWLGEPRHRRDPRPWSRPRRRRDGRAHDQGGRRACPIESLQTAQFRHGPLELVGPGARRDRDRHRARDRRRSTSASPEELADAGAASSWSPQDDARRPRRSRTIAIGPLDRALCPAVSIVPAQLLAWRLSALPRPRTRRLLPRLEGDDP